MYRRPNLQLDLIIKLAVELGKRAVERTIDNEHQ